jgi:hypothetical protein
MSIRENVEHKLDWEELLKKEKPRNSIIWDYRNKDKIETFWFSDVHLGSDVCDEGLFLKNVDMVNRKKMPCADLGDLVENATRDSVGDGVYTQQEIADAQIEMAIKLYEPIKDLLKSLQPGNHELRTYRSSGVNLTKQIAKRLGAKYGGAGLFHIIKVGNQTYTVYSSHGGSAATTTAGKFNALKRMGDIVPFSDVAIMGHLHETIFHERDMPYVNNCGKLKTHRQYLVCNGSYLDWWGSYGQIKAYSPTNKGNAKITFYGDNRQVEVSFV